MAQCLTQMSKVRPCLGSRRRAARKSGARQKEGSRSVSISRRMPHRLRFCLRARRSASTARPRLERGMGDDAAQPAVPVGHRLDHRGLVEMEARVDRHLGEDQAVDGDGADGLVEILEEVGPVDPGRAGEQFETPYLRDARALARTAPAPEPDEDALILSDLKVTKVFLSGLASTFRQLVIKVETQRGVDAWRSWATGYTPERQEVPGRAGADGEARR